MIWWLILCSSFSLIVQEQARKSLESALGGKKNEFDKWDKEIKKREESGGGNGGNGGGGRGWFGGDGWFSGDHFWKEAQQIAFTLLAILVVVCFFVLTNYIWSS